MTAANPVDAGDTLTYQIVVTNNAGGANATSAFDVRFRDILDAITAANPTIELQLIDTTIGSGIAVSAPGYSALTNSSTLGALDLVFSRLDAGYSITLTLTTRVVADAPAGAQILNSATASYSSLPGSGATLTTLTSAGSVVTSPGSSGSATGERNGTDVPAPTDNSAPLNDAVLNNYAIGATSAARNIAKPTIDKQFLSTSDPATTGTNLSIGESVMYRILITLPEGTTRSTIVTDFLPAGLEFLSATADFTGSGVTPFVLGSPASTGSEATGTTLVFTLGTLTNAADNDATNDSFSILLTARAADLATNVSGANLTNSANLTFTDPDGPLSDGTPTLIIVPDTTGTPVDPVVTIVEPKLQLVKSVDDATPDIGQVLTFTLTLTHQPGSTATAFDLLVRDTIPAGLVLDPTSIQVNGAALTANASTTSALSLDLDQLAVGGTVTVTYQTVVVNAFANTGTTHGNNARLYWDSSANDEPNGVLTGTLDGTPDRDYGAQPGVVEAPADDIDPAQDSVRIVVNINSTSGTIYRDADASGTLTAGDPRLSGVTVQLTGTTDSGLVVNFTQMTDALGRYTFASLPPGTYLITETQPAGLIDALETAGMPFGGTVSDALGSNTISSVVIPPQSNVAGDGYNFGEVLPGSLAGVVFRDDNNSGAQNIGEPGIGGVLITLTGTDFAGQAVLLTTMTGGNGSYAFANPRPGTYTLTETQPANFSDGIDAVVTLGGTAGNDVLSNIALTQGFDGTGYTFGEIASGVSGTVFLDVNRDGTLQTPADTGIGGVTVQIFDSTGTTMIGTTMTDEFGNYTFPNIPAGDYRIVETQPAGYGSSSPNVLQITVPVGGLMNQNFGETLGSLAGTVFFDQDTSGAQNGAEPGISGVLLTLTGTDAAGANVNRTATTGSDGSYVFGDLLAGNYTVRETQPGGFADGLDAVGTAGGTLGNDIVSAIGLPVGNDATGYNFGEVSGATPTLGVITGVVFVDRNKNTTIDPNEPGLGGVRIDLLDANGNFLATTNTAPDGSYSFQDLPPGTYQLRETQPLGYGSDTPNLITGVAVAANQTTANQNFGETLGSLAGTVFTDFNNNGLIEGGDTGIGGAAVMLSGTDVTGAPISLSTMTASDGTYSFGGLLAGNYTITETQPATRADGIDSVGTSGGTAGNDVLSNIALNGGIDATGYNFGELLPSLSGTVFIDRDNSATLDNGEPGIGGVSLTLRDVNGNVVGMTTTNPDGSYVFNNIDAGQFTITETQPNGYGSSTANVLTVNVPTSGLMGQNFGETTSSLAGTVYRDVDNSNTLTAPDAGIGGVMITLTGTDANGVAISLSTTTAGDGTYQFTGLLAGTYSLSETQPAAYTDGAETAGTAGGSTLVNDVISGIGLGAGTNETGYNFGETLVSNPGTGAITGTVFVDTNRDMTLTGGEAGVGGVQFTLLDVNGNLIGLTTTNPDGSYIFNNVPAGSGYSVVENQPIDYGSDTPNTIAGITVASGMVNDGNNFGETLNSVAGSVFVDGNNDGVRGTSERGIGSVAVHLTGTSASGIAVALNTMTASDGSYSFGGLFNGTYMITEDQPAAYNDGLDMAGTAGGIAGNDVTTGIALNGGIDATGYTFDEVGASLTGTVFRDDDLSGSITGTEPGIGGVTLNLRDNNGVVVATTMTNPDGTYSFDGLAVGNYTIEETQPAGYGSSTPNSLPVAVPLQGLNGLDFGETTGSISGRVFRDDNNNGLLDGVDAGIFNTTVTLTGTDVNGLPNSITQTTGPDGTYTFTLLLAGNYAITETQPGSYLDGIDTPGSVGGLILRNDRISNIGLGAAVNATGYNFAEIFPFGFVKSITSTNAAHTTGANLAIGEIVRYRLTANIPPDGTLTDFQLRDFLPNGLVFLNDATATATFILNNTPGASTLLTDEQISANATTNDDRYRSGTDVFFKIGTVAGQNGAVTQLVVEFNERVLNEARNQTSAALDNSFALRYDVTGDGVAEDAPVGVPGSTSNTVRARVVEPDVQLTKTADRATAQVGQTVTFTITIKNVAGANGADAFELHLRDTLPNGLQLVAGSVRVNGATTSADSSSGNTIDITLARLAEGATATVTYQVRVTAPVSSAVNHAEIVWTSLPGANANERSGTFGGGDPLNDYFDSADRTIRLDRVPAVPNGLTFFAYDSFNNFALPPKRPDFDGHLGTIDIWRDALLPIAPIYSGEADPGATLRIDLYNANGDRIGSQTVIVDAGGNWLASFPSSVIRDYPSDVRITQVNAPYSFGDTRGHDLRAYYSPAAINPGQFLFQTLRSEFLQEPAPLLGGLGLENPLQLGTVKYGGEFLSIEGVASGN